MLSRRLREIRIEKGYTQEKVAEYLGFTRPTYTAYESGRRKPDNGTLVKLANFFDVSLDYLLGRTKNRHKKRTPITGVQKRKGSKTFKNVSGLSGC
jgi:transcriptional regulator with XRE-family HTH domain